MEAKDIFVSYAREDKHRVAPLVEAFRRDGWKVFWDLETPFGRSWMDVIGRELDNCRAVIVIWTNKSVTSQYVKEEAITAKNHGKLLPVLFDDVEPPFPFSALQAADLREWDETQTHPAFVELARQIAHFLESNHDANLRTKQEPPPLAATGRRYFPLGRPVGALRFLYTILLIAVTFVLFAFVPVIFWVAVDLAMSGALLICGLLAFLISGCTFSMDRWWERVPLPHWGKGTVAVLVALLTSLTGYHLADKTADAIGVPGSDFVACFGAFGNNLTPLLNARYHEGHTLRGLRRIFEGLGSEAGAVDVERHVRKLLVDAGVNPHEFAWGLYNESKMYLTSQQQYYTSTLASQRSLVRALREAMVYSVLVGVVLLLSSLSTSWRRRLPNRLKVAVVCFAVSILAYSQWRRWNEYYFHRVFLLYSHTDFAPGMLSPLE